MSSAFLNLVRDAVRIRHYSKRTETTYVYWIKNYIRFHDNRHPNEMAELQITEFLNYLSLQRNVSPATQKTALNALVFFYKSVLGWEKLEFPDYIRAKTRKKIPVVLESQEVSRLLTNLPDRLRLCGQVIYGSSLRIKKALTRKYLNGRFELASSIT